MPIYEYQCRECQQIFEEWQDDFEERDIPCPVCGGSTDRLISHSAFILKGSGWYATDYAGKGAAADGNGSGNGNGEKTDSKENTASSGESNSDAGGKGEQKSSSSEGGGEKKKESPSASAGSAQ